MLIILIYCVNQFITMDLNLLGYLKDGKYRLKTLELLNESPYISSELAEKLDINRASMSRILRSLKEKQLVEPSTNNSRTVVYCITEKGKNAMTEVEK